MTEKFLFAATQQTISIVNKRDSTEFVLVKQRAHSEHDCLDGLFITYEMNGEVVEKISIHYFEKFFDYRKKLKEATYDVFELTEDFLKMLNACGEVIPSDKMQLVKRIAKLTDRNPQESIMLIGLKAETVSEIQAMEKEFEEEERQLKKEVKAATETVSLIKMETLRERREFRSKIEQEMVQFDRLIAELIK